MRLKPAGHDQVLLFDSPLQEQLVHQRMLFMSLDEDRLLKPFRARAGQPAPGRDMGGWYDDSRDFHIDPSDWSTANWHGYIPGHSFGQYISGLSRMHAANHDEQIRRKVELLVSLYMPTISGDFFKDYNLPAYTYNKLLEGLIDAHHFAGVTAASEALNRVTDAVLPYLPEKAWTREERRQRPYSREAQIWDEPYVLPENLFKAWQLGLGERYRKLALRFLQDESLFDPLALGVSPFAGKHAYSHVNALSSAIEAYYATGSAKYLKAAINGFDFLERQSYSTGGWGPNEELLGPDDRTSLANSLVSTHRSFETPCGAHAHFKITRSLLCITRDSRYGDSMERVLYNTILGARPTTAEGETFYYSDYSNSASKAFRGEAWPCCSGTFVQLVADYGISAYMLEDSRVHVNLYIPSRISVSLPGSDAVIEQRTDYPLSSTSRLRVASGGGRFKILLRIPRWAGPGTEVRINGKETRGKVIAGRFFKVERWWRQGDVAEIKFDMPMRLEPLDERHPDLVALMTGPLALFCVKAPDRALPRSALLLALRTNSDTWEVDGPNGVMQMKPFMSIKEESYRLYNKVND
ncbi:beta-L-arabinofuranosidase domain-containing protein [Xanthomonas hortorum]|uniref:beta-L-arabinofuranosidase domain-containing protein n=1 Tax=Xanthomonas hortorum TaxID=56454 RepID=UPI0020CD3C76|nr:beta-L-arabinofuranosidase domain-containing protein [Xanthomonas hortorum]